MKEQQKDNQTSFDDELKQVSDALKGYEEKRNQDITTATEKLKNREYNWKEYRAEVKKIATEHETNITKTVVKSVDSMQKHLESAPEHEKAGLVHKIKNQIPEETKLEEKAKALKDLKKHVPLQDQNKEIEQAKEALHNIAKSDDFKKINVVYRDEFKKDLKRLDKNFERIEADKTAKMQQASEQLNSRQINKKQYATRLNEIEESATNRRAGALANSVNSMNRTMENAQGSAESKHMHTTAGKIAKAIEGIAIATLSVGAIMLTKTFRREVKRQYWQSKNADSPEKTKKVTAAAKNIAAQMKEAQGKSTALKEKQETWKQQSKEREAKLRKDAARRI